MIQPTPLAAMESGIAVRLAAASTRALVKRNLCFRTASDYKPDALEGFRQASMIRPVVATPQSIMEASILQGCSERI
jgi:hypothetical protein